MRTAQEARALPDPLARGGVQQLLRGGSRCCCWRREYSRRTSPCPAECGAEAALARQQEQDAHLLDMAQYNADVEVEMLKVKETFAPLDAAGWCKHVAKGSLT